MLIFCPSCQRQLRVPDQAAGKQVKCPACQKVFAAASGSSAEQIQAPVAPRPTAPEAPPDNFEDEPRPPRLGRDDDIDLRDDREARRRAHAGATWFYATAGATMVLVLLNLTIRAATGALDRGPFGPLGPEERLAGILCMIFGCGGLLVAINVTIIAAGMQLKSFGVKGWVITGIVLALAQTLLLSGIVLINVIFLMVDPTEALDDWAPLTVLLYGSAGVLNCFAGVKAIVTLNNPAVNAEFAHQRPRRRRRRIRWED